MNNDLTLVHHVVRTLADLKGQEIGPLPEEQWCPVAGLDEAKKIFGDMPSLCGSCPSNEYLVTPAHAGFMLMTYTEHPDDFRKLSMCPLCVRHPEYEDLLGLGLLEAV
jgi:hypothetical protein